MRRLGLDGEMNGDPSGPIGREREPPELELGALKQTKARSNTVSTRGRDKGRDNTDGN